MKKAVLALKPVLAALVLGACSTNPVLPENAWKIAPVQKVRHGGSNAAGYFALGRYREGQGAYEQAIAAYRKALDADAKHAPAWNALGTLQVQLGRFDDGLAALERAVQLQPSASHLHNNLGYALLLAGRAEHAVAPLRRAVELDGSNQRAWRNLSSASSQIGALDEAAFADAHAEGRPPIASRATANAREDDERRAALPGARADSAPKASAVRPEPVVSPPVATRLVVLPPVTARPEAVPPRALDAPTPAVEPPRVEVVKIAENVFELRNGPATRSESVAAAAAIVSATTRPAATAAAPAAAAAAAAAAATVTPIRSSAPETIVAAPMSVAAHPAPTSRGAVPASSAPPASSAAPASSVAPAPAAAPASSATAASSAVPASVSVPSVAAPSSPPAALSFPPARYEIANGHGGEGLARRLAGLLGGKGFARPRLTNHLPFNQPASYVAYRDGYRAEAEALAARLPFRPQVLPSPSQGLAVDVRLLLGRDLTTSSACAVLALCRTVATKPSAVPGSARVGAV